MKWASRDSLRWTRRSLSGSRGNCGMDLDATGLRCGLWGQLQSSKQLQAAPKHSGGLARLAQVRLYPRRKCGRSPG